MRASGRADARPVPATSPSRRGAERGSAATVGAAESGLGVRRAEARGGHAAARGRRHRHRRSGSKLGTCAGRVRRVGRVCVARTTRVELRVRGDGAQDKHANRLSAIWRFRSWKIGLDRLTGQVKGRRHQRPLEPETGRADENERTIW